MQRLILTDAASACWRADRLAGQFLVGNWLLSPRDWGVQRPTRRKNDFVANKAGQSAKPWQVALRPSSELSPWMGAGVGVAAGWQLFGNRLLAVQ